MTKKTLPGVYGQRALIEQHELKAVHRFDLNKQLLKASKANEPTEALKQQIEDLNNSSFSIDSSAKPGEMFGVTYLAERDDKLVTVLKSNLRYDAIRAYLSRHSVNINSYIETTLEDLLNELCLVYDWHYAKDNQAIYIQKLRAYNTIEDLRAENQNNRLFLEEVAEMKSAYQDLQELTASEATALELCPFI